MHKVYVILLIGFFVSFVVLSIYLFGQKSSVLGETDGKQWMLLERRENKEYLFVGVPGMRTKSRLVRVFSVKTGIPGERPTPLPHLVGRAYWQIVKKYPTTDPETAPYFLELDIPVSDSEPFGPVPYAECKGQASQRGGQCNWVLPGAFGLHGVAGDISKLSKENVGSSGCIRHTDADITYLYTMLDLSSPVPYFITD